MFRESTLKKPAENPIEQTSAEYPETIRGEAQLIADRVSHIAILYGELQKRVADGNMTEEDAGAVLRRAHVALAQASAGFENLKMQMKEVLGRQQEN